ncbi:hypothetical protein IQ06DRAFT_345774 [Phaeosphaeriaceae sp. SRC1lsM3a]|nr:hypothetical protein IQ06DRAFT_345774 [Stagonospora sp. SRC1lsM3a]
MSEHTSNHGPEDSSSLQSPSQDAIDSQSSQNADVDEEPFSSYKARVIALSKDLFPGRATQDIDVERMKGGAYNRVIGITLSETGHGLPWYSTARLRKLFSACVRGKSGQEAKAKHYVLRIPRRSVHDLSYQSVTLPYLKDKLPYPTPKCVAYNSGANNPLDEAYMLQERLPGMPLNDLWPNLNHEQRKSAARCVAEVVRDLCKVKNICAGVISLRNTAHDLETNHIKIESITIPKRNQPITASDIFQTWVATPQTTGTFLLSTLARQRASLEQLDIPRFPAIWTGITKIVNKLYADGLLPDRDPFFLHHGDFALFAPKFMATRAPFYLWAGLDADEEDERSSALLEPSNSEMREYKRIFEDVVGEDFYRDSYRKEYFFLRQMWWFMLHGMRSSTDQMLAQELLAEWEMEYPTSL